MQRVLLVESTDLLRDFHVVAVREGERYTTITASTDDRDAAAAPPPSSVAEDSRGYQCSACDVSFPTAAALRVHAGSPWHVLNIQRATHSLPTIKQEEYNKQQTQETQTDTKTQHPPTTPQEEEEDKKENNAEDSDTATSDDDDDDDDAVSSSDSSLSGSSQLTFIGEQQQITVWKSLFPVPASSSDVSFSARALFYMSCLPDLPRLSSLIAVFLAVGGRFAAAVFDKQRVVLHRAFVRYTTRKKQGGSQMSHDSQHGGHQAKSIGASIRRKETVRYIETVREIQTQWKHVLNTCTLIFLYAPGLNRQIFFQATDKQQQHPQTHTGTEAHTVAAWNKADPRLRSIPFSVNKPTFAEVQRIHKQVTTMEMGPIQEHTQEQHHTAPTTQDTQQQTEELSLKIEQPNEVVDSLLSAVEAADLSSVKSLFGSSYSRPIPRAGLSAVQSLVFCAATRHYFDVLDWLVEEGEQDVDEVNVDSISIPGLTVCWASSHWAAFNHDSVLLQHLLRLDVDLTLKDSRGLTPYLCIHSGDEGKECRLLMRSWAGEMELQRPGELDWKLTGFTPLMPMSESEHQAKQAAQKEKERLKKQKQKQRQKEKKAAETAAALTAKQAEEETERKAAAGRAAAAAASASRLASAAVVEQAWQARETQLSSLSARERRALAAESRLAVQKGGDNVGHCDFCHKPILSVPFQRLHYNYDTLLCLQKHKAQQEATQGK